MSSTEPTNPDDERPESNEVLDDALDTLASILRTLGRNSFPVGDPSDETFEHHCEAWARHLLTGYPAETVDVEYDEGRKKSSKSTVREWAKLREFIRTRRRCECSYVEQVTAELRDTILVLVEGLREVEAAQNSTSLSIHQHLTRLEKSESPTELREFAKKTVQALRQAIAGQHDRLLSQLEAVGKRLRKVADDLYGAPSPTEIDAVTQLYTPSAFEQALRQHVDLTSLMNLRITLVICQIIDTRPADECEPAILTDNVYRTLSDCVARTFFQKRDILGRLSENQLGAAILDIPEAELEQMLNALLQRFRSVNITSNTPSITLQYSIVAITLKPPETSTSLLHRAQQALAGAIVGDEITVIR